MRIKEEFKKSGYFWLPAKPEKKVPGTLVVTEGGKIRLELVGLLEESIKETYNLLSGDNDLKRIIGHIEKDSLVTLEGCSYTNKHISLSGGISKSTIRAHMAIEGAAYSEDKVFMNAFKFSVEGIDEWVGLSGIKIERQLEKRTASIDYVPPKDISLNLSNGMKLLITFSWTLPGLPNLTEAKITQKTYFKLVSEQERPLSDFTSAAYKITTFLGFAIDQPVCIERVYVTSEAICDNIGNGKTRPTPMSLYYESRPYTKTEPRIDSYQMLFGFDQIRKDAERIFNKWFDAYENISPALNLYFAARTGAYQYLEGKFLALAQALETYHRRTLNPKKVGLGKRVTELIESFENFIGTSEERKNLKSTIVATRNYLTHYDKRLEPKAAEGEGLWLLYTKMEAIFQLHLLKILGFTNSEIESVYRNSKHLRDKLKEKTV